MGIQDEMFVSFEQEQYEAMEDMAEFMNACEEFNNAEHAACNAHVEEYLNHEHCNNYVLFNDENIPW